MDMNEDNESVNTEDFAVKFAEMSMDGRRTPNASSSRCGGQFTRTNDLNNLRLTSTASKDWTSPPVLRSACRTPTSHTNGRTSTTRDLLDSRPLDSVRTEEFESRFRSLFTRGPPGDASRGPTVDEPRLAKFEHYEAKGTRVSPTRSGNLTNVPVMRRDILNKFFDKYNNCDIQYRRSNSPSPPRRRLRSRSPEYHQAPALPTPKKEVAFSGRHSDHHAVSDKKFLDEDISAQIRLRTEQIKREIQNERQRSGHTNGGTLESTRRDDTGERDSGGGLQASRESNIKDTGRREVTRRDGGTPREGLDQKELDYLSLTARRAKTERDHLASELEGLQDTLRKNLAEVRMNEKLVKDSRAEADDVRMELMLAQAKRDSTKDDLDRLNVEFGKRKRQLKGVESRIKERLDDIQDLETSGLNKEEIESIIAERNELYEILKVSEDNENQRYELEKKLTAVKEDLTQEQKRNRETIVALEEELEASFGKIAEMRREKETFTEQVYSAEQKSKTLEKKVALLQSDLNDLRTENESINKEHALELKRITENQSEETNRLQSEQEKQLKEHLNQLQETNARLRAEVEEVRKANEKLSEEKEKYDQNIKSTKKAKKQLKEEYEIKMAKMEECKGKEIDLLKYELSRDRSEEITEVKQKLEKDKEESMEGMKNVFEKHISELQTIIEKKDEEATYLKSHIRLQETNFEHLSKEIETELQEKYKKLVEKEKSSWEEEEEARWQKELSGLKEESSRVIDNLKHELETERKAGCNIDHELETLRKEYEDSKEKSQHEIDKYKSKMAKLKEEASSDITKVKEQYEKEISESLAKVKTEMSESVQSQSNCIGELKAEVEANKDTLVQLASSVMEELSEECRKLADAIQAQAPKLKHKKEKLTDENSTSAVTEVVANLSLLVDDCGTYIKQVRAQLQNKEQQIKTTEQTRVEELEKTKRRYEENTAKELSLQKEKLLKEHLEEMERMARAPDNQTKEVLREKENEIRELNAGMKKWKEKTAEFLAIKLQNEFRAEFEKKMSQQRRDRSSGVSGVSTMSKRDLERMEKELPSSGSHPDAIKIIAHLKESVKRLREENLSLRKVLLGKTSLEPPSEDSIISSSSAVRSRISHTLEGHESVSERGGREHSLVADNKEAKTDSDRTPIPSTSEENAGKRHCGRIATMVENVKKNKVERILSNSSSRTASQLSGSSVQRL